MRVCVVQSLYIVAMQQLEIKKDALYAVGLEIA